MTDNSGSVRPEAHRSLRQLDTRHYGLVAGGEALEEVITARGCAVQASVVLTWTPLEAHAK